MNHTIKFYLLISVGITLFYACPTTTKIPQTKVEIAQAIRENNVVAISNWLENGGNANEKLENDQSPLYVATGPKGGFEITKLLLEKGAKVNVGAGRYTPLMNAASWVDLKTVQLLLNHGADKTLRNERGATAFQLIGDCGGCPEYSKVQALLKMNTTIQYLCENEVQLSVILEGADKASVKIMPRNQPVIEFTGTQVSSGSGAKYEGEGYTYWTKGNECFIQKDEGIIYRDCYEINIFDGTFSYMADANLFVSCDKSLRMPVVMDKEYLTLERAYTQLVEGGTNVYVRLKGYQIEVPKMEGDGVEAGLVVTQLIEIDKEKECR